MPVVAPPFPPAYNWNGFYAGGHLGYAWGTSNWTSNSPGAPNVSGSLSLTRPIDIFSEQGSFLAGLQGGYNYMLPNRFVAGAEVDASFPSFPNQAGISIGGTSNLTSPTLGAETFSETVLASGTVRGRIGYAPGNWLFYATGGFAWTYDRLTLTQLGSGATESPFLWRLGFAAGAGVEAPIAPHWTARLEYLFTDITADKPMSSKHRSAATECRQPSSVWSLAARILRSSPTCARNTASIRETPVSLP
jgi:high affinity Mn2+ porin